MSEESKTVFGKITSAATRVATFTALAPGATIVGTVQAIKGEKFSEAFDEAAEIADNAAQITGSWADRHNETVKNAAIRGAVSGVTNHLAHKTLDHYDP